MCGRYSITTMSGLDERFDAEFPDEGPSARFNAAPSQKLLIIPESSPHKMVYSVWGFPVPWIKGGGMINIRAETVKEKPYFHKKLEENRCLVIADGFYEWHKKGNEKIPYRITLKDEKPFAFAGLYKEGEDKQLHFAIITTEPNSMVKQIHTRMPVILPAEAEDNWLDAHSKPTELIKYLKAYPPQDMKAYPISKLVNKPENDKAAILKEAASAIG